MRIQLKEMSGNQFLDLLRNVSKPVATKLRKQAEVRHDTEGNWPSWREQEVIWRSADKIISAKTH